MGEGQEGSNPEVVQKEDTGTHWGECSAAFLVGGGRTESGQERAGRTFWGNTPLMFALDTIKIPWQFWQRMARAKL